MYDMIQSQERILNYTNRYPISDFGDGKMNEDNIGNKNERNAIEHTFV